MVSKGSKCEFCHQTSDSDDKEHCDVVFWVDATGGVGERWRMAGHRRVLAAASPVFQAMMQGPLAEGREISICDVEPRAFDLLLRHIYGEEVHLRSVDTALLTLYAAHKYQCEALERECLFFCDTHVNVRTVLTILHCISVYCNLRVTPKAEVPSAPSLDVIESDSQLSPRSKCSIEDDSHNKKCKDPINSSSAPTCNDKQDSFPKCFEMPIPQENDLQPTIPSGDTTQDYKLLKRRCLHFIDLNADDVLQQEILDELSQEELLLIVQRDTLCVSSEVLLFKILEQWSRSACKRNGLELSPSNCRSALGNELIFSVRYLLMTSEEFLKYPMRSELLSQDECRFLLAHILKHPPVENHSTIQEELLPVMRRHRRKPFPENHQNSSPCSRYSKSKIIKQYGNSFEVKVKPKKLTFRKKKDNSKKEEMRVHERKPNMSDYFFSCIACIFD